MLGFEKIKNIFSTATNTYNLNHEQQLTEYYGLCMTPKRDPLTAHMYLPIDADSLFK